MYRKAIVLKLINEVPQKGWHLCSLNYLLKKTARNQHNILTCGHSTPRTSHSVENIDTVNDFALSQEGAAGPQTHKTTRQIARETGILQRSVRRIVHKDIQLKCLKKRF